MESDASRGQPQSATNGSILRVFVPRKHGWLPLQNQALPRAAPAYGVGIGPAPGSRLSLAVRLTLSSPSSWRRQAVPMALWI